MKLEELKALAESRVTPATGGFAMNAGQISLSPERVLKLLAVIEAAKAMREFGDPRAAFAFDEALAALEDDQCPDL